MVPWDYMNDTITTARGTMPHDLSSLKHISTTFSASDMKPIFLKSIEEVDHARDAFRRKGKKLTFWRMAQETCHPDSPGWQAEVIHDFSRLANFSSENSYHGYVYNWTYARSGCANPEIRKFHGQFVKPNHDTRTVTRRPFPLLAGCKIAKMSNEILVPGTNVLCAKSRFLRERQDALASETGEGVLEGYGVRRH